MTEQELLAQLRDVHVPQAPGWWPPAIGWWLVGFLLLALILGALLWLRRWRVEAWRRAALREHQLLMAESPGPQTAQKLSVLMRRVALKAEPRYKVAGATDQEWLSVLDRIGQTHQYSEGVGKLLTVLPYRELSADAATDELSSLFKLTKRTIELADPQSVGSAGTGGGRV